MARWGGYADRVAVGLLAVVVLVSPWLFDFAVRLSR